ncbi:hypothetical protein BGZ65_005126, partial [Modicella reniformis]
MYRHLQSFHPVSPYQSPPFPVHYSVDAAVHGSLDQDCDHDNFFHVPINSCATNNSQFTFNGSAGSSASRNNTSTRHHIPFEYNANASAIASANAIASADASASARARAKANAIADADASADASANARARAKANAIADADASARARAIADADASASASASARANANASANASANANASVAIPTKDDWTDAMEYKVLEWFKENGKSAHYFKWLDSKESKKIMHDQIQEKVNSLPGVTAKTTQAVASKIYNMVKKYQEFYPLYERTGKDDHPEIKARFNKFGDFRKVWMDLPMRSYENGKSGDRDPQCGDKENNKRSLDGIDDELAETDRKIGRLFLKRADIVEQRNKRIKTGQTSPPATGDFSPRTWVQIARVVEDEPFTPQERSPNGTPTESRSSSPSAAVTVPMTELGSSSTAEAAAVVAVATAPMTELGSPSATEAIVTAPMTEPDSSSPSLAAAVATAPTKGPSSSSAAVPTAPTTESCPSAAAAVVATAPTAEPGSSAAGATVAKSSEPSTSAAKTK